MFSSSRFICTWQDIMQCINVHTLGEITKKFLFKNWDWQHVLLKGPCPWDLCQHWHTHFQLSAPIPPASAPIQLSLAPGSVWSRLCRFHRSAPISCWISCYARWCSQYPHLHQMFCDGCISLSFLFWKEIFKKK